MTGVSEKSPAEEQIARRAYEIYLTRGADNGHDIDDWLVAERKSFERYSPSTKRAKRVAAGQAQPSLVSEESSEHGLSPHQNRNNPPREVSAARMHNNPARLDR
jgi:hypothetical protein